MQADQSNHPVCVAVSDPAMRPGDGSFSFTHVSYAVDTTCRPGHGFGSEWAAGRFRVRRRYRDFSWLDGALAEAYPGAIHPPLPGTGGSFLRGDEDGFIEERRAALEAYLSALVAHPELGPAPMTHVFLCCPDDAAFGTYIKNLSEIAALEGAGGLAGEAASVFAAGELEDLAAVSLERTAMDQKLEAEAESCRRLEARLLQIAKLAEASGAKQHALSAALFGASLAYAELAKAETRKPGADAMRAAGQACNSLSLLAAATAAADKDGLAAPLTIAAHSLGAVQTSLAARAKLRQAARQTCEHWLEKKAAATDKRIASAAAQQRLANLDGTAAAHAAAAAAVAAEARLAAAAAGGGYDDSDDRTVSGGTGDAHHLQVTCAPLAREEVGPWRRGLAVLCRALSHGEVFFRVCLVLVSRSRTRT